MIQAVSETLQAHTTKKKTFVNLHMRVSKTHGANKGREREIEKQKVRQAETETGTETERNRGRERNRN